MRKDFQRYFGRNIISKLYIVSLVFVGAAVVLLAIRYGFIAIPLAVAGAILFFISAVYRVTDKDIDEKVASTLNNYGVELIKGRSVGKRELNENDFAYFTGYLIDKPNVRFKSGSDGKLRTSRYYVTAINVSRTEYIVSTSVYDLFESEPREDTFIRLTKDDDLALTREEVEFPRGVVKYTTADGQIFYLPSDAQADDLISQISRIK